MFYALDYRASEINSCFENISAKFVSILHVDYLHILTNQYINELFAKGFYLKGNVKEENDQETMKGKVCKFWFSNLNICLVETYIISTF